MPGLLAKDIRPGEGPFLAAVLAHPAEIGPRLVYADWLDEQGRAAEAAAIRLPRPADAVGPADWRRHLRTLARCRWPFLRPGAAVPRANPTDSIADGLRVGTAWAVSGRQALLTVRFGFVESLALRWRPFVRQAAGWFAHNPVRQVALIDLWPGVRLVRPG